MSIAFNEPKYQIETSDFRCQACSQEIACDGSYFSAVFYQTDAFQRRNYCMPCWKADAAGAFAYWKARRPPLPTDRPRQVRFDTALVFEFFRRLGEDAAGDGPPPEERAELRFVLSLLLVRKKVLNFVSAYQVEGAETLKMTEKLDASRVHWVKNPELNDAQLERVKVRIGELLQMQL